ncbi:MAG: Npt1/Npt2 family nucleotide transporter [Candidatus Saccharicenans sp.]|jgi:AAA family ATP:ADP antiporter|nr:translocase [Candidatus Saccharicenans sp.]MDH7575507.1 Npt1/Npt2 family nucleotide transporter [Candidatus Saccharicenans sp.]
MKMVGPDPQQQKSDPERTCPPGYRLLRLFTDIRPGEASKALLLTFNIFLLLLAYYIIKPVRDALILAGRGAEIKSYLAGAQAILLILVIKAFSYLASRVPRHLLITWVTLFFISNLIIFYILNIAGVPLGTMGIIFFIWIGIYNLLVPAQFWGFANDLYSDEEGRRLFPLIAFGATSGAVFGSRIAGWLIRPIGLYSLMLVSAAILGLCILLAIHIHKRELKHIARDGLSPVELEQKKIEQEKPLKKGGGFRLVFKSRYLLLIALVIGLYNFINATGEYILSNVVTRTASQAVAAGLAGGLDLKEYIGKFFAEYQFLTNLIALVLQLFLVSRIFKWIGVGGALLIFPFIALGGYGFIAVGASLLLIKWVKALENGTDYSLMNTTKHALFLITSREEKYKAKAAIDTFFVRGGDVIAALGIFLGTTYLAFNVEKFARVNILGVLIWISLCFLIIREYKKLRGRTQPERS